MRKMVRSTLEEHRQVVANMAALESEIALSGELCGKARALTAIVLTADTSVLTAIGNDYGYDEVFSRQVAGLCRKGDVLIAISTSRNSENVRTAVEAAHGAGASIIGLSGKSGGALGTKCDIALKVPADVIARIQEINILIGHVICALVEEHLDIGAG